jgi:hypothetical protein
MTIFSLPTVPMSEPALTGPAHSLQTLDSRAMHEFPPITCGVLSTDLPAPLSGLSWAAPAQLDLGRLTAT